MRVYLDHHAATPISAPVRRAMEEALEVAWANPSTARGHVQAGKMKVLGVTGTRRLSGSPNVPTFTEQGFQTIVGFAQTDTQRISQAALGQVRVSLKQTQHLEVVFVLRGWKF